MGIRFDEEEGKFWETKDGESVIEWYVHNEASEKFVGLHHKSGGDFAHTWNVTYEDGVLRFEESTGESWTAEHTDDNYLNFIGCHWSDSLGMVYDEDEGTFWEADGGERRDIQWHKAGTFSEKFCGLFLKDGSRDMTWTIYTVKDGSFVIQESRKWGDGIETWHAVHSDVNHIVFQGCHWVEGDTTMGFIYLPDEDRFTETHDGEVKDFVWVKE